MAISSEDKAFFIEFTMSKISILSGALSPLAKKVLDFEGVGEVRGARQIWVAAIQTTQTAAQNGYRLTELVKIFEDLLTASEMFIDVVKNQTPLDAAEAETEVSKVRKEFNELTTEEIAVRPEIREPKSVRLEYLRRDAQELRSQAKREIGILESKVDSLSTAVSESQAAFEAKILPLQSQYDQALKDYQRVRPELQEKAFELDKLLGLAGKKVLAGNYDQHSKQEQASANWLRRGALIVMSCAIVPLAVSLIQFSHSSISVEETILRFSFSILLSIPAAYMARESTKHRQQQYALRQTALDVGAIDAYIAPLPVETQNKIKEEIASKLFAPKSFDHVSKESYPINIQELVTKLVGIAAERRDRDTSAKETKDKSEA